MEIENHIESDCACLSDIVESLFSRGIQVRTMRDVTRGGLGTILNEIADSSRCRMVIGEEDIPVKDDVKAFVDILGLDPIYMGNEGKMVVIVPPEQEDRALEAMKKTKNGRDAKVIGEVTEGRGTILRTHLGGSRKLDVLYGESLPRIC